MSGAHNRIRTDDLFLTKEVLYRLSYVSADPTPARLLLPLSPAAVRSVLERVAGIEPAPSAWKAEVLPLNHTRRATPTNFPLPFRALRPFSAIAALPCWRVVEGVGFEPTKAEPSDLQSGPFGHSGTPPAFPRTKDAGSCALPPPMSKGISPPRTHPALPPTARPLEFPPVESQTRKEHGAGPASGRGPWGEGVSPASRPPPPAPPERGRLPTRRPNIEHP